MLNYILASFVLALASLAVVFFGLCIIFMMMETKWYNWFSFDIIKKYFRIISREFDIRIAGFTFAVLFLINLFVAFTSVMPSNEIKDEIKKKYGASADVECECMCLSCYENCISLNALKSGNFEVVQIADGKTNILGKIVLKTSAK